MELTHYERFEKSIPLKKFKDISHSSQGIVLAACFFVNIFYMVINFKFSINSYS